MHCEVRTKSFVIAKEIGLYYNAFKFFVLPVACKGLGSGGAVGPRVKATCEWRLGWLVRCSRGYRLFRCLGLRFVLAPSATFYFFIFFARPCVLQSSGSQEFNSVHGPEELEGGVERPRAACLTLTER